MSVSSPLNTSANLFENPSFSSKKIYPIICLANIIINVDLGILPGATLKMMDYFSLNQAEFGFLGSSIYIGLIISSFLAGVAFQNYKTKHIILIVLIGLFFTLSLITFIKIYIILIFSRILVGVFQVLKFFMLKKLNK